MKNLGATQAGYFLVEYQILRCTINMFVSTVCLPPSQHTLIVDQRSIYCTQLHHAVLILAKLEGIDVLKAIKKDVQNIKKRYTTILQRKLKRDRRTRENRKDRTSGVGRGGLDLFRPRGAIGRDPKGP